jgi:hypothetical protein
MGSRLRDYSHDVAEIGEHVAHASVLLATWMARPDDTTPCAEA